jgi:hypothetical protein
MVRRINNSYLPQAPAAALEALVEQSQQDSGVQKRKRKVSPIAKESLENYINSSNEVTNKTKVANSRVFYKAKSAKQAWTEQEDQTLLQKVQEFGPHKWSNVATFLDNRTGKQCRERWIDHLDPAVNKGPWTKEEDRKIVKLHREYGNQWMRIVQELGTNRTANAVKNHWNGSLKRKQHDFSSEESADSVSDTDISDGTTSSDEAFLSENHSLTPVSCEDLKEAEISLKEVEMEVKENNSGEQSVTHSFSSSSKPNCDFLQEAPLSNESFKNDTYFDFKSSNLNGEEFEFEQIPLKVILEDLERQRRSYRGIPLSLLFK